MPRAFLKTKNKGGHKVYKCGKCGKPIQPGEDYFTWKFNRGARYWQHAAHGHPRRSQLSHSKMGEVWDAVDLFDISGATSVDDIKTALADIAAAATSVAEQYSESADNIEQAFPSGNSTSEACRNTAESLEGWASELESWDPDHGEWDKDVHETEEEWLDELRESAQEVMNDEPDYQG